MHYTAESEIALPRARVIELFGDPRNMVKWQRGLVSFEPLSGAPGQSGARSKLVHEMGKRTIEMIETVTVRNLPGEFSGTYDEGVHNEVKNRFRELGQDRTRWESENEFQFSGFMKLVGLLMKGAFPEQSLVHAGLQAFAEQGRDVRDAEGT